MMQGDHSPDTLKFPDISLTMCGTHACSTSFNVNEQTIKFTIIS